MDSILLIWVPNFFFLQTGISNMISKTVRSNRSTEKKKIEQHENLKRGLVFNSGKALKKEKL